MGFNYIITTPSLARNVVVRGSKASSEESCATVNESHLFHMKSTVQYCAAPLLIQTTVQPLTVCPVEQKSAAVQSNCFEALPPVSILWSAPGHYKYMFLCCYL